ncbi:MAG: hypothetical protein GKR89_31680 [Candidatus Latescibacteria bacterium]|nr:hypothetical protein [Candidatus Latescibacterota bacterium]
MERPRWRFTANYRIHRRFQAGLELNPKAEELGPLFNLFIFTETETAPALFIGTSSDRIGSPEGKQAYYATVSKYIPTLRTSFYGSLNFTEWDDGFNFPVGLGVELGKGFSVRPMYDGDRSHLLLNYFTTHFGVSLMYVWLETPGVAFFAGF